MKQDRKREREKRQFDGGEGRCSNGKAEILTKLQTKCQPTSVFFSKTSGQTLYAFGQSLPDDESVAAASDGAKSFEYEVSVIDCSDRKNVRQSSSLYSVENTFCSEAQVKVCSPNNDESLLAAGCESGLIMMFDIKRDQVKKAKSYFLSISHISWHPAGAIVFVCGSRGEIQCLDCALNPLSFLLTSDVLTDISTTPLLQIGSHCL
uniref:Anaphase-promoting complex subunit 4 WD40 domain-containing protein n=1 Tax=Amphimedon queenslandica TaxID=400682 RepID=A0A1X7SEM2_AMPQE